MRIDVAMSRDLTASMKGLFCLVSLLGLVLVSGCLWRRHPAAPTPAATRPPTSVTATNQEVIVTPADGLSGKVARVNSNLRFVVLNFPVGQMPAINQRLVVYRSGLKVGELKVSGPQQDDNIVADIIAGEATPGDEVRDR
jgi:hypothetical protein